MPRNTNVRNVSTQTGEPASASGNGESSQQTAATWQSDPTAQGIHNAFILGWSLVELRGRVQLAALDVPKLPVAAKEFNASLLNTADPMQLVIGKNEQLLRASRLRTVFNTIVTLQRSKFPESTTVGTLYNPPDQSELPFLYPPDPDYANIGISPLGNDENGSPIWSDFRLFEVTRRAINCITLLLVDPTASLIPGLVASQQLQLVSQILSTAQGEVAERAAIAKSADAGHGLEALSTATAPVNLPAASLIATAVQSYDLQPSYNLLAIPKEAALESLEAAEAAPSTEPAAVPAAGPTTAPTVGQTDHGKAVTTLSFLAIRLLQAWDGYLRERFTAEGVGGNNLLALLAYEAGRNMAIISWDTSVNVITLENEAGANAATSAAVAEGLYQAWNKTVTDSSAVQVLHQITALSAVLDDVYYRNNEKPAAFITDNLLDDLLVAPNPALPSQVLQTVKQSVEYWQRTVRWLGTPVTVDGQSKTPKDELTAEDWIRLRQALIEQSGIWFNLMTGQQDLRGFSVENVTHQILEEAVADLRDLAQRDLPAAAKEAAKQVGDVVEVAVDFVVDISREATQVAKAGIERLFDAVHPILWWIIGISGVVVVGLVLFMVVTSRTDVLVGIVTSLITALMGLFGLRQSSATKTKSQDEVKTKIDTKEAQGTQAIKEQSNASQSTLANVGGELTGAISGVLGQTGNFFLTAYERGLARIQIELQALNFSVAVAYPLIQFFVRHNSLKEVNNDLDFLTKIIWSKESRETQLRNIVTSAFGPISILLGSWPSQANAEATPPDGQAAGSGSNPSA